MKKYDAIMIGFGKGAKTLAGKLAAGGSKVAMTEKDAGMYGGTCINVGCIPSKSLVRSSGLSALDAEAPFEEKAEKYRLAIEEKRRVTGMLRGKNYSKLADHPNIDVILGKASFVSNTVVQIETESETFEIEGEKIFINTGGTPVIPAIEGLSGNPYVYTSAALMDLDQLPQHLVIIGGGYIGLEFASMYAGFGAKVSVVQDGDTFIPREDRDIAEAIKGALEEKGVSFYLGAKTEKVEAGEGRAVVRLNWQGSDTALEAEAVLVATGRKANTAELQANQAGVELDKRGAVIVDENLKTTAENIWAMGDAKGGLQFTYVSLDDFRIIWSQMNGGQYSQAARKNVPYSVFITPSFSRVGLNEEEARKAGYNVKIAKLPAAAIPKAQVLKSPVGLLKAVIDADTDRILGAMLFCEESYEMINTVKLAMDLGADYHVLKNQIFTHPTMSEALNDLFEI